MTTTPQEPEGPVETPGGSTIADPGVFNDPAGEDSDARSLPKPGQFPGSEAPPAVPDPDGRGTNGTPSDAASDAAFDAAQRDADDMGMTPDDEKAAEDKLHREGEPQRDRLGNEDGAS